MTTNGSWRPFEIFKIQLPTHAVQKSTEEFRVSEI